MPYAIDMDPRKIAAVVYDTGGVETVLDARLWVLQQWWREIAPARP